MPGKVHFRPPPVLILALGSLPLWHSNTGLRESKRGTSGIHGADTSSGRADIRSGLADTSSARSGPLDCCSGVGRDSILLYSCIMPGKIISDLRRLDLEAARRRALEVDAHVRQTEVHSNQVSQGVIQVDQSARQVK